MPDILPSDGADSVLVGRIWDPNSQGPRVVAVRGEELVDLTPMFGTVSELLENDDPADLVLSSGSNVLPWALEEVVQNSATGDRNLPFLLAPLDLQVIKACGVTFVESMVERVIEERCEGDFNRAAEVRKSVNKALDGGLASVRPGSKQALEAKKILAAQGMWSQYLEVGLGPDPEVFTKAPVLSAVGYGSGVGIPAFSSWNNPEPELVLMVDSAGRVKGAALGNDVNLRDVEGRSALLLGMAKDNNASCAVGPFIRLFHGGFTLESLRTEEIALTVEGVDGYRLEGRNSLSRISRPFEELVTAAHGRHHQYPDGFALFTGTLFAPTQDRDAEGLGFTHKNADVVTISSAQLGTLVNQVHATEDMEPWTFGIGALFSYLAGVKKV
ncbi:MULTISPECIES: fumarylacetoacetate hydrolase family protein [Paenarthrobacter]|uniref:Fumarylacetoacetate hydrolase family protein n=1 Tax=Paenarthrobacter ureafaciens TaxID=37931 RepID=A0AAX3ENE0_PAEUR|nr:MULTISPECIES: fumarylacetoacetate hydrolase family protein [Paenarthrobacter]AMB38999.1 fumarylacetoacetate hydrolase [Arthrobacter sp. ATCC 21022]NKR12609.1 fumarylacetoacetate hydrolase [Arthrobacter sp. M5]NKR15925.1 fumarylacetoacetate hydrolase [Arthrobacter sp. M6]OEH59901.1 fumarylacetoacetate hydrolase [Arthrobacter sp. D4]OEH59953.1 fumarylacetoacetate hydrolase [Arthrobacter sp. D2]